MSSLQELEKEYRALKDKFYMTREKTFRYIDEVEGFEKYIQKTKKKLYGKELIRYTTLRDDLVPALKRQCEDMHRQRWEMKQEIRRLMREQREELMAEVVAEAFHPKRVERLLELGGHEYVDATLGY